MRQKAVTLCEATWAMAQKKENFSEWVRSILLEQDEETQVEKKAAEKFFVEHGRYPRWWTGK